MSRFAVLTVPLALILCAPVFAQDQSQPPASPDKSSTQTTTVVPIQQNYSPRQLEEMRADIYMARKDYAKAIHGYQQILDREPNNATLLNKVGVAFEQLSKYSAAGRYFKRAMKADKAYASAINNYGTVEYAKKHYGKAIQYYQQALALNPTADMSTVYSNLGYAYFGDKKYSTAMQAFQTALDYDPDVFTRHSGGAGKTVQQRSTTDPGLFYYFVAKTYARLGDAEHCAHYLKMARDDGYKNFMDAEKDPEFSRVIKDQRVLEVLHVPPSYAGDKEVKPLQQE